MPEGLEIDYESNLKNTVAFHKRHIIVNTGDRPWPKKIDEDEESYAAKVKGVFAKGGSLFDVRPFSLNHNRSLKVKKLLKAA